MSSHSLARQPTLSRTSSSFLLGIVATLPEAQVRNLLVKAAAQYPEIAEMLLEAAGPGHKHGHRPEAEALAAQAARDVHQLDQCSSSQQRSCIHRITDSLHRLIRNSEGWLASGDGARSMEGLLAIAVEMACPDQLPGVVWEGLAASGTFGDLAFAMERAAHLCSSLQCQAFQAEVMALHKLLSAHGIHHFADVLYSLRLKVASSPSAGASPKYL